MKRLFILSILVALLANGSLFAQSGGELPAPNPDLVAGLNQFALELYQQMPKNDQTNAVFSGYSIAQAFAMAYAGARGDTAEQIASTLHFGPEREDFHFDFSDLNANLTGRDYTAITGEDSEARGFTLRIANALWGQSGYPFRPEYIALTDQAYGGGFREIDFIADPGAATDEINTWVEDQTEDRIQDLIPDGAIDAMTRLVITNAIYFNASWQNAFPEGATSDDSFTLLDGSEVTVRMMNLTEGFRYVAGDGYAAIDLPYLGGDVGMIVLLPDAGNFADFEAALDYETFVSIRDSLMGGNQIAVSLPQWEYAYELTLKDILIEMGIQDAFSGELADFTGVSDTMPDGNLYISDALHKAFIKVDEEGTEAAAATALIMRATSAPINEPLVFRADRPFIYLIHDWTTGSILFMGRVMNPAGE